MFKAIDDDRHRPGDDGHRPITIAHQPTLYQVRYKHHLKHKSNLP